MPSLVYSCRVRLLRVVFVGTSTIIKCMCNCCLPDSVSDHELDTTRDQQEPALLVPFIGDTHRPNQGFSVDRERFLREMYWLIETQ